MSNRRFLLLSAVLAAPLGASAQVPPPDARAQFQRGVVALRQSRFAEAVEALEASVAQRPSPPAIYNLGFAYRGLGRHRDAVAQFDLWLARPSRGASPSTLAAVRDESARLRATLVTLSFTPPDATLVIDGRDAPVTAGSASMDPGHHALDVRHDRFAPVHRDEVFAPGGRIVIALQALPEAPVQAPVAAVARPVVAVARPVAAVAPPNTPHPRVAEAPPSGRPWVLPVVIAGAVLVVAGGITAGVLLSNDALVTPPPGTWGQLSTR